METTIEIIVLVTRNYNILRWITMFIISSGINSLFPPRNLIHIKFSGEAILES